MLPGRWIDVLVMIPLQLGTEKLRPEYAGALKVI
jgi:hypothetical protein